MAKKKAKVASKPVREEKQLAQMTELELGLALNKAHNQVHQAEAQRNIGAQNVNAIVAEIKRRSV